MPRHDRGRVRFIFTYGTLMSSASGEMGAAERALLNAFGACVGPTSIRGNMFDAGACPGVVLASGRGDMVEGELWRIPVDMPDILEALDRYEGCAPHCPTPYPYGRHRIRVRCAGVGRVTAWIYLWERPTAGLVRITDGRWRGPSLPTLIDHTPQSVAA